MIGTNNALNSKVINGKPTIKFYQARNIHNNQCCTHVKINHLIHKCNKEKSF